jgi:16S rRNA (guanine1516-N2)-methyltransferase
MQDATLTMGLRPRVWMCFTWAQSNGVNRPHLSPVRDVQLTLRSCWEERLEKPRDDGTNLTSPHHRVCVVDGTTSLGLNTGDSARELSSSLSLPLIQQEEWLNDFANQWDYALGIEPYTFGDFENYAVAIQRRSFDGRKTTSRRSVPKRKTLTGKSFFIDFFPPESSRLGKRTAWETGRDLLVKAVGPGRKEFLNGALVYDLTAGFGQDSLLLALAGAKHVHMIERNPIVAALLSDAMRRLRLLSIGCSDKTQREHARDLCQRLSLQVGDGIRVAKELVSPKGSIDLPDIIYLDPMFPPRTKSALVKKNMQVLHQLLESQAAEQGTIDNQRLFQAAYDATKSRLVVKRPINARPLLGILNNEGNNEDGIQPSYSVRGKVNRWDVYTKAKKSILVK